MIFDFKDIFCSKDSYLSLWYFLKLSVLLYKMIYLVVICVRNHSINSIFSVNNFHIILRLMQFFSANFPLSNFNYSHGLELAVNQGWISSISEFVCWQKELIDNQLLYLDLPMLKRFYFSIQGNDQGYFSYYLRMLLSFRDTYELRMEEQERGEFIVKLILNLGLFLDDFWYMMLKKSMLAGIAWLGYMWKIPLEILCVGYAYSSLENNIISGLKLVPFGQFVAQKLLIELSNLLPEIFERADFITDEELGSSFPFQGIMSSCHETQDSRLFRS